MADYRMSSAWRKVFVQDVYEHEQNIIAAVIDTQTGNTFTVPAMTFDGLRVISGQMWMCTRDTGQWRFSICVSPAAWQDKPDRTFDDVLHHLADRGLIHWMPNDSATTPERPHLAYLGEFRLFVVGMEPRNWLRANGQAVSRNRWRDLFNLWGTTYGVGDGSSTFGLANITAPAVASGDPVAYYVCCA